MRKLELSGTICKSYRNGFHILYLLQPDGYKIDLIFRATEFMESYSPGAMQAPLTVRHWITDAPCSKQEAQEGFLHKLYGNPDIGYEKYDYQYSEYTSGTDYDSDLKIGGHDLFQIIIAQQGKFIHIEFEVDEPKNTIGN